MQRVSSRPDLPRLFVALWLPPSLAEAALTRLDLLRRGSKGVRWVRPDQLHLTLKFLGETPLASLPDIQTALARVAEASSPIELGLTRGGAFPPSGPPRVVWLGLEPQADLGVLAGRVEEALHPLGFPAEKRPFHPHLTLGRAEPGASFDHALLAGEIETAPEIVSALSLVQSELRPGGSIYRPMVAWKMAGGTCFTGERTER